jgi:hypothetical protein
MKVTRDVVKDLLPMVLAGEASADTRALVDEWLRTDRDLAFQVEKSATIDLPAAPPLPPTIEKQSLDRTRRHLRWRSIFLGFAIYLSTLPLTITFSSKGYSGLLIDNWPERFVIIAIATVAWLCYLRMRRNTRATGV